MELKASQDRTLTSLEICAGGGGQALGLEQAGFEHLALVEIEPIACVTLNYNRPEWKVIQADLRQFSAKSYQNVDLLAGGVPCQPFSVGGKQEGQNDERDLFPEALRLVAECQPKAVMLENVRGLLDQVFDSYREHIISTLSNMGYTCSWKLINSCDYGVSQLRPRAVLVALKNEYYPYFRWPARQDNPPTVGELLFEEMSSLGWENAAEWRKQANKIAPTLVGGSKKHGGADLGPTRARKAWASLGVDGNGIAEQPPVNGSMVMPKLTIKMAALVQGFPPEWKFAGKRTPAYRQIGNAFPPPVAKAIGLSIKNAILSYDRETQKGTGL